MNGLRNLLTDVEAARKVRMTTSRLIRLARAGDVPCVRLPDGELRFDPQDLAGWIGQHKHEGAGMFGLLNPTDKKKWRDDQEIVASKDATKKELRKLLDERAKVERRVKVGELTGAALGLMDEKINAVRKRLHRIAKLEVEMPDRCPEKKLRQQREHLRRRKAEAGKRKRELGHVLDDMKNRRDRKQREFDEHGETWPQAERARFRDDLQYLDAEVEYAQKQYDDAHALVVNLKAEWIELRAKMIQAKA